MSRTPRISRPSTTPPNQRGLLRTFFGTGGVYFPLDSGAVYRPMRDFVETVARPPAEAPLRCALPGPLCALGATEHDRSAVLPRRSIGAVRRPYDHPVAVRLLVVDNYDSFVYNLVQELGELGAELTVHRNDALDVPAIRALSPDAVLLSPGPGRPEDAGVSVDVVRELAGEMPVFGVCLGHQAIGQAFGAEVVQAPSLMHGKTSEIHHDGTGVFEGLPNPFVATRYHSLVLAPASIPPVLEVTATTADGVVMGVRHRTLPVEGVQFHPESILTDAGPAMLANLLAQVAGARASA